MFSDQLSYISIQEPIFEDPSCKNGEEIFHISEIQTIFFNEKNKNVNKYDFTYKILLNKNEKN